MRIWAPIVTATVRVGVYVCARACACCSPTAPSPGVAYCAVICPIDRELFNYSRVCVMKRRGATGRRWWKKGVDLEIVNAEVKWKRQGEWQDEQWDTHEPRFFWGEVRNSMWLSSPSYAECVYIRPCTSTCICLVACPQARSKSHFLDI